MVNDRGAIKWTSMMLPEHVELLKKLWNEDQKVEKPMLDMQHIEWLEQVLTDAKQKKLLVELTVYSNNRLEKRTGKIRKLDAEIKQIHLQEQDGNVLHLPFRLVTDVMIKK